MTGATNSAEVIEVWCYQIIHRDIQTRRYQFCMPVLETVLRNVQSIL
jgi:hypothetical protein